MCLSLSKLKTQTMKKETKFTRFMDMHSGGGTKESPFQYIYIEAAEEEANSIFYNKFGHNPNRVTCTCCGEDYSIEEYDSLEQATAYERGCEYGYLDKNGNEVNQNKAWKSCIGLINGCTGKYIERVRKDGYSKYTSLEDYLKKKDILVVYEKDIKPEWRDGDVPEQGYVWKD